MISTVLKPVVGRSALPFIDASNPDRPLVVNFYRPAAHKPEGPVVVVQHGMMRNGDDYRDFWIEAAEKHSILIVAPTFSQQHFPQAENYNNGIVIGPDGGARPRASWIYGVPARVMEALRQGGVTTRAQAHIFGHSAGGQFVHRMLATEADHSPFDAAMAANSGWYTLPLADRAFPAGTGGIGLDEGALARWLAFPMTIFAGDQDIDTKDPNLPSQPEALAQGPTRYARAHFMLDLGRREAERLGVPCNWKLISVPGVGHDGAAMSRAAAGIWFEGAMPSADVLRPRSAARVL